MRVAQFVDSLTIGGAEIVALNLAQGLCSNGIECDVWGMCSEGELTKRLANSGIVSTCFHCPAGVSIPTMIKIGKFIKKRGVDAIVTHHFRQLFHALPAASLFRVKLIHVEHDYHFYQNDPDSLRRLRFMLPFIHSFVGVSEVIADWFRKELSPDSGKFTAIQNGVDIVRFKPDTTMRGVLRVKHSIADDELVIGTCARLEPVKNLELLVRAFASSTAINPRMRLVIVGDGSCRKDLESLSLQLGVSEKVLFAGLQENIEELLTMFDIYAITSHDEGLPMSVLEAMAAGLPILATNVGSLSQVVSAATGELLDEPTVACAQTALLALAADPCRRSSLAHASRQCVIENYSVITMVEQYKKLLTA